MTKKTKPTRSASFSIRRKNTCGAKLKGVRMPVLLLTLAILTAMMLSACSSNDDSSNDSGYAGATDTAFSIYNYSSATVYAISLTPPSGSNDGSDDIVLYDDFDNHIQSGDIYKAQASLPGRESDGTWRVNVSVRRGEAGGSSWEEFEMAEDLHGFSLHDIEGRAGVGITILNSPPDSAGGGPGAPGSNNADIDYEPGPGEYDWRGTYNNRGEIFVEIFDYDGRSFGFKFYLPSGGGTPQVTLSGVAEIDPVIPSEAYYDTITFSYFDAGGLFIVDIGDYSILSGMYDPEGGYDTPEAESDFEPEYLSGYYYLNGDPDEQNLYFYSDGTLDFEDSYGDETEGTYEIIGSTVYVTFDGETTGLEILDEDTLMTSEGYVYAREGLLYNTDTNSITDDSPDGYNIFYDPDSGLKFHYPDTAYELHGVIDSDAEIVVINNWSNYIVALNATDEYYLSSNSDDEILMEVMEDFLNDCFPILYGSLDGIDYDSYRNRGPDLEPERGSPALARMSITVYGSGSHEVYVFGEITAVDSDLIVINFIMRQPGNDAQRVIFNDILGSMEYIPAY